MKRTTRLMAGLLLVTLGTAAVVLATDSKAIPLLEADQVAVPAETHDTVSQFVLMIDMNVEIISVTWWRGSMSDGIFKARCREREHFTNHVGNAGKAVDGQQYYSQAMTALGLSDAASSDRNIQALLGELIKAKRALQPRRK